MAGRLSDGTHSDGTRYLTGARLMALTTFVKIAQRITNSLQLNLSHSQGGARSGSRPGPVRPICPMVRFGAVRPSSMRSSYHRPGQLILRRYLRRQRLNPRLDVRLSSAQSVSRDRCRLLWLTAANRAELRRARWS